MNFNSFLVILALIVSMTEINGFYVPGIAPREFKHKERIGLKNTLILSRVGSFDLGPDRNFKFLDFPYFFNNIIT